MRRFLEKSCLLFCAVYSNVYVTVPIVRKFDDDLFFVFANKIFHCFSLIFSENIAKVNACSNKNSNPSHEKKRLFKNLFFK